MVLQSFLHNRLGGLQVLPPGSESWQYVKVCFYAWNLRSNLHRVLYDILLILSALIHVAILRPPPLPQAGIDRYSLVYFTRPGNSIILRALVDESLLIAEAVSRSPEKNYETGATALEWFSRRIKNQRIKNRKVIYFIRKMSKKLSRLSRLIVW